MSINSALCIHQVSLSIGDKAILKNINFGVERGEVLGVLGPNGAGKTSLLKVIAGQKRHQGVVNWCGHGVADYSIQALAREIAVVNQLNDVVFSVTLKQVVRMGLLPHKTLLSRETATDSQRVEDAIQAVGLEGKLHQEYSSLSGGEQQRGLIARALVQGSPLLILDEPVNHLDVYYQHQVLQLLHDLARQLGVTVVMSLHDMNLASQYCDKIALLNSGDLIAYGEPEPVLNADLLTRVFSIPCEVKTQNGKPHVSFTPSRKTVLDLSRWGK